MKRLIILTLISGLLFFNSCKKEGAQAISATGLSGQWHEVKLTVRTVNGSGNIITDTTFVYPSIGDANYLSCSNNATCTINSDIVFPGGENITDAPLGKKTTKFKYTQASTVYILKDPSNYNPFVSATLTKTAGYVVVHTIYAPFMLGPSAAITQIVSDAYYR